MHVGEIAERRIDFIGYGGTLGVISYHVEEKPPGGTGAPIVLEPLYLFPDEVEGHWLRCRVNTLDATDAFPLDFDQVAEVMEVPRKVNARANGHP